MLYRGSWKCEWGGGRVYSLFRIIRGKQVDMCKARRRHSSSSILQSLLNIHLFALLAAVDCQCIYTTLSVHKKVVPRDVCSLTSIRLSSDRYTKYLFVCCEVFRTAAVDASSVVVVRFGTVRYDVQYVHAYVRSLIIIIPMSPSLLTRFLHLRKPSTRFFAKPQTAAMTSLLAMTSLFCGTRKKTPR